ncbi:Ig-like domain-containing protein [Aeromicrobium choanae]|uniref:Ig-like domain (Group 3) n=1 Tax=Aeromicrobium choanae TaxID=1736691 RepID=A0A1T4Z0N5_9ACTN|nr:Ig-like domain-containing protein [Aeromicrobium choanae]SKB07526.1 Ig-like domain (group 3) [Aeromicrobium choanae]
MYRRVTSVATSAALGLAAAVALMPTSAHAAPETFTGHVQVIVGDTIIGCATGDSFISGVTTDADQAYRVSISAGTQQDLTLESRPGHVVGVNENYAALPISQSGAGYTFLTSTTPVPAGSPSVEGQQSAIWSVDPDSMELSATFVWPDSTTAQLTTYQFEGENYLAVTDDLAAVRQIFSHARAATFRIGEACSGEVVRDAPQAITFTSSAPTSAHAGQTYTVAATGGASGNPVTFSSTTADICSVDGTTVTFDRIGTCTIAADQAAAEGFLAAETVEQDITVNAIATSVDLTLDPASAVTGEGTTATAQVDVESGSIGAAGGVVQFRVDGDPVDAVAFDGDGAASTRITEDLGTHQVEAFWWPETNWIYGDSSDAASLSVTAASTTTRVSVKANELSAVVEPVAPGAGTPTGEVTFRVDGAKVGTATLENGTAKLTHTVATDKAHAVSAEYAGSTDFNASSASTSRSNPTITTRVSSSQKSRGGWYRTPVKVSFECTSAAQLATPCPKPVTITKNGSSSVTRTIRTADGGVATATAAVKLDRTKPSVGIKGVKAGRSYFDAPQAKCSAKDSLSGVKSCKVTTKRSGSRVVVSAQAIDVAGNIRTKRVAYRLASYEIQGAKLKNGVYRVKHGETYTIRVRGAKANYVYATPAPGKPHRGSVPFEKAGKNTWALGVTMSMTTSATRSWNLGYTQNGKLHVIKVKVAG